MMPYLRFLSSTDSRVGTPRRSLGPREMKPRPPLNAPVAAFVAAKLIDEIVVVARTGRVNGPLQRVGGVFV